MLINCKQQLTLTFWTMDHKLIEVYVIWDYSDVVIVVGL